MNKGSILNSLLVFAIVFFVLSIGVATFFLFDGFNVVSNKNIDLSVSGPISVRGGEEIGLLINIANKNSSDLKYATLKLEFPEGAKTLSGNETTRFQKFIGDIKSGQSLNETVQMVFFGEENSKKDVYVVLEYRTENSNAIFVREEKYQTSISSSPLSVLVSGPDNATNNEEVQLSVRVSSNTESNVENLLVQARYPSGFVFKSAEPKPSFGNSVWRLGDLSPSQERTIKIFGLMKGQDGEQKVFTFSSGISPNVDANKIEVIYNSGMKEILISKPSLGLNLILNGRMDDSYIAGSGELIRADIEWANNLPVRIENGEMTVKINGQAVNKSSISSNAGFFKSFDNSIVWNKSTGGLPQTIEPGQTGNLSFSFAVASLASLKVENPEINIELSFVGSKLTSEGAGEILSISKNTKIVMSSDLQLAGRVVYHVGPFTNTGPLPPVREKVTTYTIIWSVVNSSNSVSNVKVRASLPSYIEWLGNISPSSENITYNPLGGEIIWDVGDVVAGSGTTKPVKEVAFQVALRPSVTQVNNKPILISEAVITGKDLFTKEVLSSTKRALNTDLISDPKALPEESAHVK